jgi:hypothetical protein
MVIWNTGTPDLNARVHFWVHLVFHLKDEICVIAIRTQKTIPSAWHSRPDNNAIPHLVFRFPSSLSPSIEVFPIEWIEPITTLSSSSLCPNKDPKGNNSNKDGSIQVHIAPSQSGIPRKSMN